MDHSLYQLLPLCALGLFLIVVVYRTVGAPPPVATWIVPATLSLLFLGWSVYTVAVDGTLGFWSAHVRDAWGNQIWFDLLLAVGIGWTMLLPRVRAVGMNPWPWLALVLCTGCIGLTAMLARCLYLERHIAARAPAIGGRQA